MHQHISLVDGTETDCRREGTGTAGRCLPIARLHLSGGSTRLRLALIAMFGALLAGSVPAAESGASIFENHCIPCHGPDGRARTPAGRKLGAKDLRESKLADSEIAQQIRDGAKDPRGADKMPSFREKVTPAQIEALVDYVKTFRSKK